VTTTHMKLTLGRKCWWLRKHCPLW